MLPEAVEVSEGLFWSIITFLIVFTIIAILAEAGSKDDDA